MINALKSVLNYFGQDKNLNSLFLAILISSILLYVTAFVMCFTVKWFDKPKRSLLISYSAISLAIGISLSIYNTYFIVGYVLVFCLDVFFISIVMIMPSKKFKVTEKQKELVQLIDNEIKKETPPPSLKPLLDKIIINQQPKQESKLEKPDVDFSHVGGILERLDYFPLSASDKKQVNSLRTSLLEAQNGKTDYDTKRKINDGLSDLLKIMSKYGV